MSSLSVRLVLGSLLSGLCLAAQAALIDVSLATPAASQYLPQPPTGLPDAPAPAPVGYALDIRLDTVATGAFQFDDANGRGAVHFDPAVQLLGLDLGGSTPGTNSVFAVTQQYASSGTGAFDTDGVLFFIGLDPAAVGLPATARVSFQASVFGPLGSLLTDPQSLAGIRTDVLAGVSGALALDPATGLGSQAGVILDLVPGPGPGGNGIDGIYRFQLASAVPAPASLALLAIGLGLGLRRRHRQP